MRYMLYNYCTVLLYLFCRQNAFHRFKINFKWQTVSSNQVTNRFLFLLFLKNEFEFMFGSTGYIVVGVGFWTFLGKFKFIKFTYHIVNFLKKNRPRTPLDHLANTIFPWTPLQKLTASVRGFPNPFLNILS